MTPPLELVVHEDPVTGTWSFHLDSHAIEVAPRHGFLKIDGHLHRSAAVEGLHEVTELAGTPLAAIKRLIALHNAQHDHTQPIHADPAKPTTPRQEVVHDKPAPRTPTTPRHRAHRTQKKPSKPTRATATPRTTTKPSKPRQTKAPIEAFNTIAAAKYLGLSPKTLETKRSRGDGPPFVKLGRRVVYRQADLDTWLADRVRSSTSAE